MKNALEQLRNKHVFSGNHEKIQYYLVVISLFLVFFGIFFNFSQFNLISSSYDSNWICKKCEILHFLLPGLGIITLAISILFFGIRSFINLIQNKKIIEMILKAIIFVILIFYLFNSQIRYFDNDEYEHLHNAGMMMQGTIPYFDINSTHTPLLEWLISLFMHLVGESLIIIQIMRLLIFLVNCGSLWLVYLIVKKLGGSKITSLIAVLLVITNYIWMTKAPEIRPDNIMLFFALLSFLALINWYNSSKIKYLVLFLLLGALSFLGKQNAAIFYLALMPVFLFDLFMKRKLLTIRNIVIALIVLLVFLKIDSLREIIILNIKRHLIPNEWGTFSTVYPLKDTALFNPTVFIFFILQLFNCVYANSKRATFRASLIGMCLISLLFLFLTHIPHRIEILLIVAYIGLFGSYMLKEKTDTNSTFRMYLISVCLISLLFLFLMNQPYRQELLLVVTFMSVFGAYMLGEILQKLNWKVCCVIILFISLPVLTAIPNQSTFNKDLETTKTILEISSPDDLVFDSYGKAIFRHSPLEPYYLMYMPSLTKEPETFDKLKNSNVKYLIKDEYYVSYREEYKKWFDDNFVQTKENQAISIRSNKI